MAFRLALPLLVLLALPGCVRTVANVVTFPVRATAQGVDWATTSQDEADRNRGRKMRKEEERRAKEERKRQKEEAKRLERARQPY
jgi:hypothetical protein